MFGCTIHIKEKIVNKKSKLVFPFAHYIKLFEVYYSNQMALVFQKFNLIWVE